MGDSEVTVEIRRFHQVLGKIGDFSPTKPVLPERNLSTGHWYPGIASLRV
jgi:hypothetical protein